MNSDDGSTDASLVERVIKYLQSDDPMTDFLRDLIESICVVLLIGLLIFGVSGVWPPMVAVESGSMTPTMHRGDLIFVMDEHRFSPQSAYADTGIVTYRAGQDTSYRSFGNYGDVIIFSPVDNSSRTQVIHRARFWVNESENWYGKANPAYLSGKGCQSIPNCPAPHSGFITKGDSNGYYDQVGGISSPVRPAWITGEAKIRIPWLGHIRLALS